MQIETSSTLQGILDEPSTSSTQLKTQQNSLISEGSFSNQYIIVQDRLIAGKAGTKTAKQNSEAAEIKIVDGTTTFLAKQQLETLNDLDQETFLRHSEI